MKTNYYGVFDDTQGMRSVSFGEQWNFGASKNRDVWARLGKVIRVDEENGVVDLRWLDHGGQAKEVPLALPFGSRRGMGLGMPSRGSIAVCVFIHYSQYVGKPIIVGYIKSSWPFGIRNILDKGFGEYSTLSDDFVINQKTVTFTDRIGAGIERQRNRKTYPGDIHLLGDCGAELYLDDDVQLASAALDEFLLRSDDQTANLVTGTSRMTTEGGRHRFGIAYRNDVISWHEDDSRNHFDDENKEEETDQKDPSISSLRRKLTFESRIKPIVTRSGKFLYIPTTEISERILDDTGTPWVEDILEMREVSDGIKDVTEDVHDHDIDSLYPASEVGDNHTDIFIRRAMGTYVGNDPTDKKSYGVAMYRRIFEKFDSWEPDAPGKEFQDLGEKKETDRGPKWVPINRTYFDSVVGEVAESVEKSGLDNNSARLRIRENQEASLFHLEFTHTGQFGRTADSDSVRNTAIDITKEGVVQFLISASSDEHVIVCTEGQEESILSDKWKSSGRSAEGHFEGSIKLSHGANTNEEESFRQTALGKFVHLHGASEDHHGEPWKDKKREDENATAFIMDGAPGGSGSSVMEMDGEGTAIVRTWPVVPKGLKVANRRRSGRVSTWGGHDWFLGRTVDNCLSWNLATAGQVKQWIGATPTPQTVNEEEPLATNKAGRVNCSVIRRTTGSIEEFIGRNDKEESWNTVFQGQIKHRIGFTEKPEINTNIDEMLDILGPNGPGRTKNSVNREIEGSVEEHIGVNEFQESYSAILDGQLKMRIGTTQMPMPNIGPGLDVVGPIGPGDRGNSVNLEMSGSLEASVGKNVTLGDSVVVTTSGGWDVAIGSDNSGNAVSIQAAGGWTDMISGTQTRTIVGAYTRTAPTHTLVGDVAIIGNLSVTGDIVVSGNVTAGGVITDSDGDGGA